MLYVSRPATITKLATAGISLTFLARARLLLLLQINLQSKAVQTGNGR